MASNSPAWAIAMVTILAVAVVALCVIVILLLYYLRRYRNRLAEVSAEREKMPEVMIVQANTQDSVAKESQESGIWFGAPVPKIVEPQPEEPSSDEIVVRPDYIGKEAQDVPETNISRDAQMSGVYSKHITHAWEHTPPELRKELNLLVVQRPSSKIRREGKVPSTIEEGSESSQRNSVNEQEDKKDGEKATNPASQHLHITMPKELRDQHFARHTDLPFIKIIAPSSTNNAALKVEEDTDSSAPPTPPPSESSSSSPSEDEAEPTPSVVIGPTETGSLTKETLTNAVADPSLELAEETSVSYPEGVCQQTAAEVTAGEEAGPCSQLEEPSPSLVDEPQPSTVHSPSDTSDTDGECAGIASIEVPPAHSTAIPVHSTLSTGQLPPSPVHSTDSSGHSPPSPVHSPPSQVHAPPLPVHSPPTTPPADPQPSPVDSLPPSVNSPPSLVHLPPLPIHSPPTTPPTHPLPAPACSPDSPAKSQPIPPIRLHAPSKKARLTPSPINLHQVPPQPDKSGRSTPSPVLVQTSDDTSPLHAQLFPLPSPLSRHSASPSAVKVEVSSCSPVHIQRTAEHSDAQELSLSFRSPGLAISPASPGKSRPSPVHTPPPTQLSSTLPEFAFFSPIIPSPVPTSLSTSPASLDMGAENQFACSLSAESADEDMNTYENAPPSPSPRQVTAAQVFNFDQLASVQPLTLARPISFIRPASYPLLSESDNSDTGHNFSSCNDVIQAPDDENPYETMEALNLSASIMRKDLGLKPGRLVMERHSTLDKDDYLEPAAMRFLFECSSMYATRAKDSISPPPLPPLRTPTPQYPELNSSPTKEKALRTSPSHETDDTQPGRLDSEPTLPDVGSASGVQRLSVDSVNPRGSTLRSISSETSPSSPGYHTLPLGRHHPPSSGYGSQPSSPEVFSPLTGAPLSPPSRAAPALMPVYSMVNKTTRGSSPITDNVHVPLSPVDSLPEAENPYDFIGIHPEDLPERCKGFEAIPLPPPLPSEERDAGEDGSSLAEDYAGTSVTADNKGGNASVKSGDKIIYYVIPPENELHP